MENNAVEHIPVLAEILAEQIRLPTDGVMVDATIGHGGHSLLFGRTLGPAGVIVGLDIDEKTTQRAHLGLKELVCRTIVLHANFSEMVEQLRLQSIEKVDFILADLGVSSSQLTDETIGLSFQSNMPLDMRMDERLSVTAADIVNKSDEKSLADLIYRYGEDRASRRIARFIVEQRRRQKITTTGELAAVICRAMGHHEKQKGRIHPATRTFQALRIAVNHELENLQKLLDGCPGVLRKGGRVAVISFHSLEDRIVKNNFRKNEADGIYQIVTKKPIVPSCEEKTRNRRARSAKLRIAERQ